MRGCLGMRVFVPETRFCVNNKDPFLFLLGKVAKPALRASFRESKDSLPSRTVSQ